MDSKDHSCVVLSAAPVGVDFVIVPPPCELDSARLERDEDVSGIEGASGELDHLELMLLPVVLVLVLCW